ncbi:ribosomal protein S5 domain 2-like protein [Myriangium duriaei CBS 260.36]|uniref:Ribosomal RNA-processing protein 41 n=1 Tax=Myriangium duriaei CBS 260.36 TaxID=1168546 RepID=A0A9P4J1U6_9PEZI|nr:ribosomal protein S5 domain 2-like protein [Myriangium duriaei CBS 260.36]
MPLDTSSYALAHLRLDGRRWNELRHLSGQISTQAAADGSSYLEMGNTKVLCTVTGPAEPSRRGGRSEQSNDAKVEVEIDVAAFATTDRRRRARGDKRTTELSHLLASTFSSTLFTHLYPHSTITITLHVLSSDGSLLAALINASTLALVDAGIPMPDYVAAVTAGSTATYASNDGEADPLLDLSSAEETELPFLTLATVGKGRVACMLMETRVQTTRLESMVAVAVDGCAEVRRLLDEIVRAHGREVLAKSVG